MGSEQELFARLRQPFNDDVIKWKIQINPKENDTFALCVAYVDARDVAARLNEVVGIAWESAFGDIITFGKDSGVQCRLTVLGHTRADIGTFSATEPLKGGYSDALKRAAVHFGVAAYVYAFPKVQAEVKKYGKSFYFTDNAKRELLELTACIHAGATKLPVFRAIKVRDYAPIDFSSPYYGGEEGAEEQEVRVDRATKCSDCGHVVTDYLDLSSVAVVNRSLERYGRVLCAWCAQKAKKMPEWEELLDAGLLLGVITADVCEWPGDDAPLDAFKTWERVTRELLDKRLEQLSERSGTDLPDNMTLAEKARQGVEMLEVIAQREMADEAQR